MTFPRLPLLLISLCLLPLLALLLGWLFIGGGPASKLQIPKTGFFGEGPSRADNPIVEPFRVNISQSEVSQLNNRLRSARVGHSQLEDVPDWTYGVPLSSLMEWRDYWLHKFDWNKMEQRLNQFPQFITELEGLKIHFWHIRPPRPAQYRKVVPLLLVHGWPGGVFEFHRLIPLLSDPKAHSLPSDIAFELIVPSLPGYGWSQQPRKLGFSPLAAARIFHRLLTERLGHSQYLAQGGDWGSLIVQHIARMFPHHCRAIHLNMAVFPFFQNVRHSFLVLIGSIRPQWVFSDPQHFANFLSQMGELLQETGYMHIQATKPDTIGVGLNDSPLGLLAYLLEKYSTWTNPAFRSLPDGGILQKFSRDDVLTLISVYWLQGNILSSQRFYRESFQDPLNNELSKQFVTVPTGYAAFQHDMGGPQPKEIVQLYVNLTRMTIVSDGGHFAALEKPRELADDFLHFANGLNLE